MLSECSTASARLCSPAFAFGLVMVALMLGGPDARAQEPTVVIGGAGGGGVFVDLSVLDQFDRPGGGTRELRFPGARLAPNEGVTLHPPGSKPRLKRPKKKKRVRRAEKRKAPTVKPAPRATAEAAPKPKTKPKPTSEPTSEPTSKPAPRVATAPPKPVTAPPPAPKPATPKIERSAVPPPPPAPKMDRATVPPPPPPSKSTAKSTADMPPVTAAPRAGVASTGLSAPKAPQQTAARPRAPEKFGAGATRIIAFDTGASAIPAAAKPILKATAQALKKDTSLRVQLKAYAAGGKDGESRARRLSLTRALGVRSFLIKQGVQPTRIDVRALGNKAPGGAPDRVDLSIVAR